MTAPRNGPLEAAISSSMVSVVARHTGRGPTKARTTLGDDLVVCVMGATLTPGERTLAENGHDEVVLDGRRAYQSTMAAAAIEAVERLTSRTVAAFMSCNHIDPDLAAEVFVLVPAVVSTEGAPA
ncbi:MAG: Na-translocating system protein MpsC family protein [Solirubrobacteraceae bacterium]